MNHFSALPLKPALQQALTAIGYHEMTPIQALSLPTILQKQDVIAQAKTGSGKTCAFALAILNKIQLSHRSTQALVVCPTRELCEQVANELRTLARKMPNFKVLTLCGGSPLGPQRGSLEHGVHCVVGTPGRLVDHLSRATLDLRNLASFVLDEADRLLDMGFADELDCIIEALPKNRQTLLFSATYPENIRELSARVQHNPQFVQVDHQTQDSPIEQLFFKCNEAEKTAALSALLAHYQLSSTVVFCNTKLKVQEIVADLQAQGCGALALHGDLLQAERDEVLMLFSNKSSVVLVATDVAARGLDIKDLHAVINVDLARSPEVHIHRIGRTGRAGQKGLAFSLVSPRDARTIAALEDQHYDEITLQPLPKVQGATLHLLTPSMGSLRIEGGKKNKLRPGDILGALTAGKKLAGAKVGTITIFDFHSLVAIERSSLDMAFEVLAHEAIKGRRFKVRKLA
jgi:ATP-independent RNA helicase DbpA